MSELNSLLNQISQSRKTYQTEMELVQEKGDLNAYEEWKRKYAESDGKYRIVEELQGNDIEVIYDDRTVSAGVMFSDADLLGVPLRIIVSPRNLKGNCCEIVSRDKSISMKVPFNSLIEKIVELIASFQETK